MNELEEFKMDRDEALLSLNEDKIWAYIKKYKIDIPENGPSFWPAVHKAITACKSLPMEFRKKSKAWLDAQNYTSHDDGDL